VRISTLNEESKKFINELPKGKKGDWLRGVVENAVVGELRKDTSSYSDTSNDLNEIKELIKCIQLDSPNHLNEFSKDHLRDVEYKLNHVIELVTNVSSKSVNVDHSPIVERVSEFERKMYTKLSSMSSMMDELIINSSTPMGSCGSVASKEQVETPVIKESFVESDSIKEISDYEKSMQSNIGAFSFKKK